MARVLETEAVLTKDQILINRELHKIFDRFEGVPSRLRSAMRYAVFSGGKRLRPILALESYRACGGKKVNWIIPFCCGIELIHTFSLIHDDLPAMDNDDFRRGKQTLHRQFDEGTAILAGDALFALAFELFALSAAPAPYRVKAVRLIAQAVGPRGMAGGQMFDIEGSTKTEQVARLKTAEFIAASIDVGAVVAGAPVKLQRKLHRLGLITGVLFQLTDDLLDIEQDAVSNSSRKRSYLTRRANLLSERAAKGFATLGSGFSFFAELPEFIMRRKA
jgi:geranylgeranyl diphosphate synthase type II